MALVILGKEIKQIPIKSSGLSFDLEGKKTKYTDSKGVLIKKIKKGHSEYVWLYENGSEYDGKAYKNIKGKPVKEFGKTTLIDKDKLEEVSLDCLKYFINNEHTYLLCNPEFKDLMKEKAGSALSFKYVNRGFKIYKAIVYYDDELDRVFMRCYTGDLRKANLDESIKDGKDIESVDEVESLDLDSLEV